MTLSNFGGQRWPERQRIISFIGLCATTPMWWWWCRHWPKLKVKRSKGQLLLQWFGKFKIFFHFWLLEGARLQRDLGWAAHWTWPVKWFPVSCLTWVYRLWEWKDCRNLLHFFVILLIFTDRHFSELWKFLDQLVMPQYNQNLLDVAAQIFRV